MNENSVVTALASLVRIDLTSEETRDYTVIVGKQVVFEKRFFHPTAVYCGSEHRFHRVECNGELCLMPTPGIIFDSKQAVGFCLVTWTPKNPSNPVTA